MRACLDFDCGNTRIKWRFSSDGGVREGICGYELEEVPQFPVSRIRIASVLASERLQGFLAALGGRWSVEPEFARVQEDCAGLRQGYRDLRRLGVDRWLAMLAAHRDSAGACVVVSCGTAITVDAVTTDGEHLGGYIVPGLEMMRAALFSGTGAVKLERIEPPADLKPGRDTIPAVIHGMVLMVRGLVESARADLSAAEGSVETILSGGDGDWLRPYLSRPFSSSDSYYRPNLVLDGLALALP